MVAFVVGTTCGLEINQAYSYSHGILTALTIYKYKSDTRLMASFQDNLGKPVKPIWIIMKQETMGWQWHQVDHMQIICTSLQSDNHANNSPLNFYRPGTLFLTPNKQCQST